MTGLRAWLGLCLCAPAAAFAWQYSALVTVSELQQPRTFQHLESSGNRSIAISKSDDVAVVWEDNRSGKPAVYVAYKSDSASQFSSARQISDVEPAYEPAVVALNDGRFLVAWEAKDHIWARIVSPKQEGSVVAISADTAREVTLTSASDGRLWLAWAQKAGPHFQIVYASADVRGDRIQPGQIRPVDPAPPKQDQLYPSIALVHKGAVIAWEDRRYGHTRLFTAYAAEGKNFTPLRQLNALKARRSEEYGNGTGAMRPVLASDGNKQVVASWLDKRDFTEGYDVYAAFSKDGGVSFGGNEKVEDMLGANQAQWHAVTAMDRHGHTMAAWDDQRDGSPDIWLSWFSAAGWSDDENPKGASGPGSQSHPAMAFDRQGRLHLVFLDRVDTHSAIRYLVASPSATDWGAQP
ncbi:MAG: hypothetical protein GC149_10960 [Gammaproteobacteria bacterium]|nr:hypothetical protein [Gammaproteobacteria bacterium]